MPEQKSSMKDNILSAVMLIAAAGMLYWRVNDCRQKEAARDAASQQEKKAAEDKAKARMDRCMGNVAEKDRTQCMKCMCDRCIEEFESCEKDPDCKKMAPVFQLDAGADAQTESQLRNQSRTQCTLAKCRAECLGQ